MAKRRSIQKRAKGVEVKVQQYLWPDSFFAGNAKRPAHESQDVCGPSSFGEYLWGEVKNNNIAKGGLYSILDGAYEQCVAAIERDSEICVNKIPVPFSVIWPVGSRSWGQRLVLFKPPDYKLRIILTLEQFKENYIGDWVSPRDWGLIR